MARTRNRALHVFVARELATHTVLEWELMKLICGPTCLRCKTEGRRMEKDHITPVSQGGSDGIWNLQPLCARCNCSKGRENIDYRPDAWWDRMAAVEAIATGQRLFEEDDDG